MAMSSSAGNPEITKKELEKLIQTGSLVLIDVRQPHEWEAGFVSTPNVLGNSLADDLTTGVGRCYVFLSRLT